MADINTTDLQTYVKSLINDVISGKKEIIMEKQDFTIPNISCDHCVAAIKNELDDMLKPENMTDPREIPR